MKPATPRSLTRVVSCRLLSSSTRPHRTRQLPVPVGYHQEPRSRLWLLRCFHNRRAHTGSESAKLQGKRREVGSYGLRHRHVRLPGRARGRAGGEGGRGHHRHRAVKPGMVRGEAHRTAWWARLDPRLVRRNPGHGVEHSSTQPPKMLSGGRASPEWRSGRRWRRNTRTAASRLASSRCRRNSSRLSSRAWSA